MYIIPISNDKHISSDKVEVKSTILETGGS